MARHHGDALVGGRGAGITASGGEALFERVDVVDINPAMSHIVDEFSGLNWGFPADGDTRVLWRDGLTHLRRTERRYDAIINTSTNPGAGSSVKLFTRETFEAARDRLKPGGVYVTWLDSRLVKPEAHSLIATLERVFADCAYQTLTGEYMLMICGEDTDKARSIDLSTWPERVRERLPGLKQRHRAKFIASQLSPSHPARCARRRIRRSIRSTGPQWASSPLPAGGSGSWTWRRRRWR